jgi:hypothetical protein
MLTGEHGGSDPARVILALLITAALLGPGAAAAKPGHGSGESKSHESKSHDSKGGDDEKAGSGTGQAEARDEARGDGDEAQRSADEARGGKEGEGHDQRRGEGGREDHGPSRGATTGRSDSRPAGPVAVAPDAASQPPAAPPATPTVAAPAQTPSVAAPSPPARRPITLFRAFAATEARSVLAATLEGDPMDAPPLLPFLELRERQAEPGPGRPAAAQVEPRAASDRAEQPSLPFSGFSLLALVVSGLAAITSGRRLHEISAAPALAPRGTEPVLPEPALADPLVSARSRHSYRTTIALGAAAFAVTALAVSRAR